MWLTNVVTCKDNVLHSLKTSTGWAALQGGLMPDYKALCGYKIPGKQKKNPSHKNKSINPISNLGVGPAGLNVYNLCFLY